jgi:hypothetical protein
VREYYIGMSIGQYNQHTAVVLIEREKRDGEMLYYLTAAERFNIGVQYPAVIASLQVKLAALSAREGKKPSVKIITDITGVGVAIAKLFEDKGIRFHEKVTITNGIKASRDDKDSRKWNVPKRDLVSSLQVLFQTERLKIAGDLPEAATIVQELTDFELTPGPSNSAGDAEGLWREKAFDDYVFSVAVALWSAERQKPPVFKVVNGPSIKSCGDWRKGMYGEAGKSGALNVRYYIK